MTNKTGQNSVYDSGQRSTVVFLPGEERDEKYPLKRQCMTQFLIAMIYITLTLIFLYLIFQIIEYFDDSEGRSFGSQFVQKVDNLAVNFHYGRRRG